MSFLKYTVQTGVVRFFLMAFGIIGGVITARWLGPEGVGVYALLSIIPTAAFRIGNLGMGSALTFFVARGKIPIHRVLVLTWLIGVTTGLVICVFLLLSWRHQFSPWNDIQPTFFYVALLTVPTYFVSTHLQSVLSGQLRITNVNVSQALEALSLTLFIFVYVVLFKLGVLGAILAFVTMRFLVLVFLALQFRSKQSTIAGLAVAADDHAEMIELWHYGKWSYLNMLLNFFFEEIPLFLLKYFGSNEIVGFFIKSRELARKPRLISQPFSVLLLPYTAASKEKDATQRTNILCRNMVALMFFIMLLLAVFVKPATLLLFGEAFRPMIVIFYAIMPTMIFYALSQFLGVHIAGSGNPRAVFFVGFPGLVASVLLGSILIPKYGALGAACSISGGYFVMTCARLITYMRFTKAKLSDVLLIQKADLHIYRMIFQKVASRLSRKRKITSPLEDRRDI